MTAIRLVGALRHRMDANGHDASSPHQAWIFGKSAAHALLAPPSSGEFRKRAKVICRLAVYLPPLYFRFNFRRYFFTDISNTEKRHFQVSIQWPAQFPSRQCRLAAGLCSCQNGLLGQPGGRHP
ncbi:hypothetical protein [Ralstonia flatus]|uniref:hypothetical protein n=1 Tax=Ralstonia flatus TaxID=3058601 RepID=UPI00198067A6|nr:hypothetical protein [Ralstonia sp. LMG 32965]MBN6210279.1 hypothetical protein [Ralstonia pickettii]